MKLTDLVAVVKAGHEFGWHVAPGYEYHDEGAPYCPDCDNAEGAKEKLAAAAPQLAELLIQTREALQPKHHCPLYRDVGETCREDLPPSSPWCRVCRALQAIEDYEKGLDG